MSRKTELAEKVFKPGNLVSGRAIELFGKYVAEGVRPPKAVGKDLTMTPNEVCLTLLADICLPDRYEKAFHFGPGGAMPVHKMAIIVSRERLIQAFPDQVFAVGEAFRAPVYHVRKIHYKYRHGSVFDIPIKDVGGTSLLDEVRLCPSDVQTAAVTEDLWEGVVLDYGYLTKVEGYLKGCLPTRTIPVFTPYCRLITDDLRKLC